MEEILNYWKWLKDFLKHFKFDLGMIITILIIFDIIFTAPLPDNRITSFLVLVASELVAFLIGILISTPYLYMILKDK